MHSEAPTPEDGALDTGMRGAPDPEITDTKRFTFTIPRRSHVALVEKVMIESEPRVRQ